MISRQMKRKIRSFLLIIIPITLTFFALQALWHTQHDQEKTNLPSVKVQYEINSSAHSRVPRSLFDYVKAHTPKDAATTTYPKVGEDSCPIYYGKSRIDYWRSQKSQLCKSLSDNTNQQPQKPVVGKPLPQSQIACHHVLYKENDPRPENLCDVHNLALDVNKILQTSTNENPFGYPPTSTFHVSQCQLDKDQFAPYRFGWAGGKYFFQGLSTTDSLLTSEDTTTVCDAVIDHNILLVSRWDTTNIYHAHEEFLQTFSAYAVTDLDLEETEIWLGDNAPVNGTFQMFFERIFTGRAHQHPLIRNQTKFRNDDPSKMLVRHIRGVAAELQAQGKKTLCLSRIVFGVFAGISSLSRDIGNHEYPPCHFGETGLFFGFRDFLFERYGFLPDVDMAPSIDQSAIRIVISSRREGAERQFKKEEVLVRLLQEEFCKKWLASKDNSTGWMKTGYACHVSIQLVDFATLHVYDQLLIMRSTDLIIGAHGCSLTLAMYMPLWGGIIEFWHPSRTGNYHFARIARIFGLLWTSLGIGGDGDGTLTGFNMPAGETVFGKAVQLASEFVPQILQRRAAVLNGTYIPQVR